LSGGQAIGLDHVVLEHADGLGHGTHLVATRGTLDLGGEVVVGQAFHGGGHALDRAGHAEHQHQPHAQAHQHGDGDHREDDHAQDK
jgi:hypothetical protein